jgi:deazaflavin-dependent oxidoreductase (nitroreductase family)
MLIRTTGRNTGKPREVMVDIMDYDKATDTYYIEAAYGARADWYKNIQSNPIFEAQAGRRKFKARAESLSQTDAGELLVQFHRRRPAYTRSVMLMAGMKFKDEADLRAIGNNLTLLAVRPEKE